jgi:translation elongation factor EF-G
MRVNLRPRNPKDLDLLFFSIRTAMADDPALSADYRETSAVVKGMGELHLEVSVRRIIEYFGDKGDGIEVGNTSVIFFQPVMHVAVVVPDTFVHEVHTELRFRQPNKTRYSEQHDGATTVTVVMPLMKLKGLAGSLRKLTEGRARSVLTPCGHEEIDHKELMLYLCELISKTEGEENGPEDES